MEQLCSEVVALLGKWPCAACRKAKAGCSAGVPCRRCSERCLQCDRGPLMGLLEGPCLVFAATTFEAFATAYTEGVALVRDTGQDSKGRALRFLRMWTKFTLHVGADVTHGAADAVAKHFSVAPEEVGAAGGEAGGGMALVLDGGPVMVLQATHVFRLAEGDGGGVAMWALGVREASLAVNERFSNMIGSAEELSSWASQYAALPAYLLAAMLVHDDRADFLRQLAQLSFSPPSQTATLFAKGISRSGKVDLWMIGIRTLVLEDTRLALVLRVQVAPTSVYLNHRPGQHTTKALGPSSCPASMLGQQPLPHRPWQGSPSLLPLALHLHAGLAGPMWQPPQDVKEEAPPAQWSPPPPLPPAAGPGPFSPASDRQSETSTGLWGLPPPSPFDPGVDVLKGEDPGLSSSSSNA